MALRWSFNNKKKITLIFIFEQLKSPQEARQRLAYWNGVTCEDFSFLEMTMIVVIHYQSPIRNHITFKQKSINSKLVSLSNFE